MVEYVTVMRVRSIYARRHGFEDTDKLHDDLVSLAGGHMTQLPLLIPPEEEAEAEAGGGGGDGRGT